MIYNPCICVHVLFACVQNLIGHQYLIDSIARVREVHERVYGSKPVSPDMLKTNSAAKVLIGEIVECKRKNMSRMELLATKQATVVGDHNSCRLSCRVPLLRELVAIGDFDPQTDAPCRRPFLALAGYDADPVLVNMDKRTTQAATLTAKVAKPRAEHPVKPLSDECFAKNQTMWVRVTQKVSSVWVQNNSMCLDVLDESTRCAVMAPNSESFHGVIIDLPYGANLAEWDTPFSREQVRAVWLLYLCDFQACL